jgi:hypothetical protein
MEHPLSSLPTHPEVAAPKSKHSLLPLLVFLFVVSYGLLTMLVVEQGRTIDTQRALIRDLFGDSSQLLSLKGKLAQKQHALGKPSGKAQAQSAPGASAAPQGRPAQGDSNQAKTRLSDDSRKSRKALPQKPPKAQDDDPDARRINVSI